MLYWDDWDNLVPILQKSMTGTLTLADLFVQHNEHRAPVSYLAYLILARLTRLNTTAEMYLSWGLLCLTALLLFLAARRRLHKIAGAGPVVVLFPAFALLFSYRQYESILWASPLSIYLMLFSVVLTFYLLDVSKGFDCKFGLSCTTATIASFSFFNGILVWPVGFAQIFRRGESHRRIYCWAVVAASNFVIYFYGWMKPSYHPSWTFALNHPIEGAAYFFTLMGSVFDIHVRTAFGLGIFTSVLGLLVVVQSHRSRILRSNGFWLSLILFMIFSSLVETIGRSGFGVHQALAGRYTPMTAIGLAGLYVLAISVSKSNRKQVSRSLGAYALLALLLLGVPNAYFAGWQLGQQWGSARQIGAYVIRTYDMQSDWNIVTYLFPSPSEVQQRALFLQQNGLNVFSQKLVNASKLALIDSDTPHALDTIDGIILSQHNGPIVINASEPHQGAVDTIRLTGWAADALTNNAAFTVFITVDGRDIPTMYGLDRRDVSAAYHNPNYRFSGFYATFSASVFGPGLHTIGLKVVSQDHLHYYYLRQVASYVVEF